MIPAIIDGMPPDNFPPALRYELGADGTITDQPVTVLGPDLRESGDGKSLGLAKVIAGLIGIGTDEVFRRAERARKARAADAGGAQKRVSMIDCEKRMTRRWSRYCYLSCLPAPTR